MYVIVNFWGFHTCCAATECATCRKSAVLAWLHTCTCIYFSNVARTTILSVLATELHALKEFGLWRGISAVSRKTHPLAPQSSSHSRLTACIQRHPRHWSLASNLARIRKYSLNNNSSIKLLFSSFINRLHTTMDPCFSAWERLVASHLCI